MPNAHPDLWQRYQATKAASTAKYARDIAAEMGISEAELTAARLGHDAVRLSDDARALIAALERVGETKCICRNEYAVHEQVGQFTHQHLSGHAGLVLNPRALDLRLFLSQWASAFHLNDNGRQSIQFFRPPRRRPAESLCDHADRHGGLGDPDRGISGGARHR